MDSGDETIICKACGAPFVFCEGERAYYAERGYRPPVYCRDCRDVRRATSAPDPGRRTWPARCDDCGQMTTVPFEPSPGKPVYCDECFRKRRASLR